MFTTLASTRRRPRSEPAFPAAALACAALLAACLSGRPAAAQDGEVPPSSPDTAARAVEVVELGGGRHVRGPVLKETDSDLFVDLGFDVLRIPLSRVVRRRAVGGDEVRASERQRGIYYVADREEKSVAEGAREVGSAVVRIDTPLGQGSGFLTSPEGFIVTNFHVVEDETRADVSIYVRRETGLEKRVLRDAKVVAINPVLDLALLKVDPPGDFDLPYVYLGDSDAVRVGDRVYAIGTPRGLERTVSEGIISVPNQHFWGRLHIQTTTPINPGNSGGPLFNLRGEVVAVNTLSRRGDQGLNFSIPSKYVKEFLANRESFALDSRLPENGIHYLPAPPKPPAAGRGSGSAPDTGGTGR